MNAIQHNPASSPIEIFLIDAAACAASGSMSCSWWYEQVRAGRAPQPVVRKARCTRWRADQVRQFWVDFTTPDFDEAGTQVIAKAQRASDAAKAKRAARVARGEGAQ